MKRNSCPNTDSLNLEATHTHGIGINKKRYKSSSSSNGTGVIASCSLKKGLENETPQESITSYDLSLNKIKKSICRFFYENGLDLKAVPSFQRMMSHFLGQKIMQETIPTCHELKGWIFKDAMKDMRHYVDGIRKSWPQTGCSILLDGWMDGTSRHLVNILVDCPRGTVYLGSAEITDCFSKIDAMQLFLDKVIQEVGIDNVVQIITYSTSAFMKGVGKQLMEAYRPIFWTVSASACIELMLEKLESMDLIKETLNKAKIITRFVHSHPVAGLDLIKPSKIRSTQPFLTLENIVLEKQVLKTVFLSSDSNSSIISTVEGKRVADLMRDSLFWSRALTVSKATIPLVRVMEWMNESCNKEQVAYIYETIDQAKDTIKEGFKHKKSQYVQFWKVVDDVWNELLYSPLHSAGYFLNPNLFYSSDVFIDPEVATGLLCCIVRSTKDVHVQDRITIQMELYRMAKGAFGVGCAVDQRSDISPALWWSKYGGECPELQRLAVRILSQTCEGASKFQLKRSLAEALLTKGRNPVEQKRLADMVFLQYNMQLQNFASGETDCTAPDEVGSIDDDWIVDKANDGISCSNGVIWMELDGGDDAADLGAFDLEGPSCNYPKEEPIV